MDPLYNYTIQSDENQKAAEIMDAVVKHALSDADQALIERDIFLYGTSSVRYEVVEGAVKAVRVAPAHKG